MQLLLLYFNRSFHYIISVAKDYCLFEKKLNPFINIFKGVFLIYRKQKRAKTNKLIKLFF